LALHLPNLQEVNIKFQGRPDASWLETVRRFKSLRVLVVDFCEGRKICDTTLAHLLNKMPGLLIANFSFNESVNRHNTPFLSGQPCALRQVRLNFNRVPEDVVLYCQKVCIVFLLLLHFQLLFKQIFVLSLFFQNKTDLALSFSED